jgi:hypothetical protein
MCIKFWLERFIGRDSSEYLNVNGSNIEVEHVKVGWEGVNRIHLAQDRDR